MTNNYEAALLRLQSQEKSLRKKDPSILEAYSTVFKDYEIKGYIQKVPKSEVEQQWFLPHFPVIKPSKDTTKVRVVFDAAMKHDGRSLNDSIRPGPKLQREIVDVLTRFRRAPVALSADISEMFLQVGLQDKDRSYLPQILMARFRSFKRARRIRVSTPVVWQYCLAILRTVCNPCPRSSTYRDIPSGSRIGR